MSRDTTARSVSINRRRFLTTAGAAGALGLAGCVGGDGSDSSDGGSVGETGGSPIEVEYWRYFGGGDGFAMEQLVERFNEEHDDIQVNEQQNPVEGYVDQLYAAASGNNMPDIVAMFAGYARVMQDLVEPIDPYISDDTEDAYFDVTWDKSEVDGDRLFLPIDFHGRVMYYNQDILNEVGADQPPAYDWDAFMSLCSDIDEQTDAQPFALDVDMRVVNTVTLFYMHYMQRGNEPFVSDSGTSVTFDNEQAYETARLWNDIHNGEFSWDPLPVDESGARLDAFRRGDVAMMLGGNWDVNAFKDEDGNYIDLNFGIQKPLQFPGGGSPVTWGESNSIYLADNPDRDEETTEASVRVMEWITQNNEIWGTKAGHLPAATDVANSDEVQSSQLWNQGPLEVMSDIASEGEFSYIPQMPVAYKEATYFQWTQDVFAGNVDPVEGVNQGAAQLQQSINDA